MALGRTPGRVTSGTQSPAVESSRAPARREAPPRSAPTKAQTNELVLSGLRIPGRGPHRKQGREPRPGLSVPFPARPLLLEPWFLHLKNGKGEGPMAPHLTLGWERSEQDEVWPEERKSWLMEDPQGSMAPRRTDGHTLQGAGPLALAPPARREMEAVMQPTRPLSQSSRGRKASCAQCQLPPPLFPGNPLQIPEQRPLAARAGGVPRPMASAGLPDRSPSPTPGCTPRRTAGPQRGRAPVGIPASCLAHPPICTGEGARRVLSWGHPGLTVCSRSCHQSWGDLRARPQGPCEGQSDILQAHSSQCFSLGVRPWPLPLQSPHLPLSTLHRAPPPQDWALMAGPSLCP